MSWMLTLRGRMLSQASPLRMMNVSIRVHQTIFSNRQKFVVAIRPLFSTPWNPNWTIDKVEEINRNIDHMKIDEIFPYYRTYKKDMNAESFAKICKRLAREHFELDKRDPELLNFLDDTLFLIQKQGLNEMQIRYFSFILDSISKLQLPDTSYGRKLVDHLDLVSSTGEFSRLLRRSEHPYLVVSMCAKACATLNCFALHFFNFIESNCSRVIFNMKYSTMRPFHISSVAWACAELDFKSPNLFETIEERAEWFVYASPKSAVSIAMCASASAKLGIQSPKLFQVIESNATWFMEHANAKAICNFFYACAKLEIHSPSIFQLLGSNSHMLFRKATPREISDCAWACAVLGVQSPTFFRDLELHSQWMVSNGDTEMIAKCVWACATLQFPAPTLFQNLNKESHKFFQFGSPQDILTAVWALAEHKPLNLIIISLLEAHSDWLKAEGDPEALIKVAHCLRKQGVKSHSLLHLLEDETV